MLQGWFVIAVALVYIGLLFAVASYGDRLGRLADPSAPRPLIYSLSLAIYCTTWTFFGSVGLASRTGFEFLAIYLGPAVMLGLAGPLVLRITRFAKAQNIVSIADFIAARYGKHQGVAATVAVISIIGMIPYIALQLKAVSASLGAIVVMPLATWSGPAPMLGDPPLWIAMALATFAVLFGTRHNDATEHQHGLILAIAVESIVKLVAFVAVGIFVTWGMFDGPSALLAAASSARPDAAASLSSKTDLGTTVTITLLSFFASVLLPRQFYVTVVENKNALEIRRAAWLFPLYLIAINLFVIPIATAGLLTFPPGSVDSDMYVLLLPVAAGSETLALLAFLGGLSAAAAMVIVESVALAIMISNDIVMPFALKRREGTNIGDHLLTMRRVSIFGILLLSYLYFRSAGDAQLAAIGLMAFAAIAQLAPAFFGGLVWRRATASGAVAGMVTGIVAWAYTMFLPSLGDAAWSAALVAQGPFGIADLRPQALFGFQMPPLIHGTVWSLALNLIVYVLVSLYRAPAAIERMQADIFVPRGFEPAPSFRLWRSAVTVDELITAVARYLGEARTRASFDAFASGRRTPLEPGAEADFELLGHAERLMASAIGAASSRLVVSHLLRRRSVSSADALKLLDEANAAIHSNREILQTAIDHVRQGIAVFDRDAHLVCWNRQFGEILLLPDDPLGAPINLGDILRFNAERGAFGRGDPNALVRQRLPRYAAELAPFLERFPDRDLVVEVRVNRMPDGGIVTTLTDITPSVAAAEALERANENLERRVRERTQELERLNAELAKAKAGAEAANLSKTRFLAAASHDILQPLNAARLYVASLVEQQRDGEAARLAGNIDASLEAVDDILAALLEISRLDASAMKPDVASFSIAAVMAQLALEFEPLARTQRLDLVFVPCSLSVRSDRRLLRRLLENLISNALKYTLRGRVLVGCRRRGDRLQIQVLDSGIGIPPNKLRAVFTEFHRLEEGARVARGLGLGLSIVERIARVLDHPLAVGSTVGKGSQFSVTLPIAAAAPAEPLPHAPRVEHGAIAGMRVLCIDNDSNILDAMTTLLGGWGCTAIRARDLTEAETALRTSDESVAGLLVDYHLDVGNGIEAVISLRRQFGPAMPAALITADRSPPVREAAHAADINVLNKPLKPASLRAVMSQWRTRQVAAAE